MYPGRRRHPVTRWIRLWDLEARYMFKVEHYLHHNSIVEFDFWNQQLVEPAVDATDAPADGSTIWSCAPVLFHGTMYTMGVQPQTRLLAGNGLSLNWPQRSTFLDSNYKPLKPFLARVSWSAEMSDAVNMLLGKLFARSLVGTAPPHPISRTRIPRSE